MKEKESKFISVRVKILCSLVFVSVLLVIAVVTISYRLAMDRVERIGMQLSGQYVVSAGEDIKGELKALSKTSDEIMEIKEIRELAQLTEEDAYLKTYLLLVEEIQKEINAIPPHLAEKCEFFLEHSSDYKEPPASNEED